MTKEEAISLLKQVNEILINSNSWLENTHEPLNQAFGMAIKALEQQPTSDDCVSRQAVLDLAVDYGTNSATFLIPVSSVKNLPPVTPTRKVGKWKAIDDTHSQCMECGAIFCITSSNEWEVNYCPNCGKDMRGTDNE